MPDPVVSARTSVDREAETTRRLVALALHYMTVEDNPGHADRFGCAVDEASGCYTEAARLVDHLADLGYRLVNRG